MLIGAGFAWKLIQPDPTQHDRQTRSPSPTQSARARKSPPYFVSAQLRLLTWPGSQAFRRWSKPANEDTIGSVEDPEPGKPCGQIAPTFVGLLNVTALKNAGARSSTILPQPMHNNIPQVHSLALVSGGLPCQWTRLRLASLDIAE